MIPLAITVRRRDDFAEYKRQHSKKSYYKAKCGSFENKIKTLLYLAKSRARKKGLEFSITINDLHDPIFCPLQPHLTLDYDTRGRGGAPNSPSIDRIDPTKGYVPGNVWIISAQANRMKSNATISELETLVANLKAKMGL